MVDTMIKFFIFVVVCCILMVAIKILKTTEQTQQLVSEVTSSLSGLDIVWIQEVE